MVQLLKICGHQGDDDDGSSSGDESSEDEVVTRINQLLSRPWRLRRRIGRIFRLCADTQSDGGARAVTSGAGWAGMKVELAEQLNLPAEFFSNGDQLFERFDFDGDRLLEKAEVVKLVKYVLRQRRRELSDTEENQDSHVPMSSLSAEGYTIVRELGRGGQGAMYLCNKSMTVHQYCVKFYSKADANAGGFKELIDEYELMRGLDNEHIAQTYHIFQDREFYYLVNEPYFGGDLTKLAKRAADQGIRMGEAWWRALFRQCVSGLEYLHRKAVMHCDIKEPNIMIANGLDYSAPRPILIDFGLSEPFSRKAGGVSGTPGYIPPETWETGHWYPAGDIYSLGITIFQIMTGQVPSSTGSVLGVLQPAPDPKLLRSVGLSPRLPWNRFPKEMPLLEDLVRLMTAPARTSRLRAPQCLTHRWFSSRSDGSLPQATLTGLLGAGATYLGGESVVNQLVKDNNLNELRMLRRQAEGMEVKSTAKGALHKLREGLKKHGMDAKSEEGTRARMRRLLDEAIWAKRHYSHHYISDLFNELDSDKDGRLSVKELSALLDTSSFECPFVDIQELVTRMGPFDRDGCVSFEQFRQVVMEDGRIAHRTRVERENRGGCSAM